MIGLFGVFIWFCIHIWCINSQSTDAPVSQRVCCQKDMVVLPCYNPLTENTCENLRNASKTVQDICVPDTCVCRDGLYRNVCGECVTAEECLQACAFPKSIKCLGQFETLYGLFDPTQARVCPSTRCSKPRDFLLKYATTAQQRGLITLNMCDCIPGYFRNKCGQCVPPNECGKKCCLGKCSPCSGPNEVRMKKFRKCHERSCKNRKSPTMCTGKAGRVRKNVCDCKIGYRRNNCSKCVLEDQCDDDTPCLCTNPCREGRDYVCVNECNRPTCKNYYELKNGKTCPDECMNVCSCSLNENLWFNGSACVPGDQCPPYEIAKDFPYLSISQLLVPKSARDAVAESTTTTQTTPIPAPMTTTTATQAPTTQAAIQNPGAPLISITLSVGLK